MLDRLKQISESSSVRNQDEIKAEETAKKYKEERKTAISAVKEKLEQVREDQRFKNAQEDLPYILEMEALRGETKARVFVIGFRDTKGDFQMDRKRFEPESPQNLIGAGKRFYDWLKNEGFEPAIEGVREEYFGRDIPRSTGLHIVVSWK